MKYILIFILSINFCFGQGSITVKPTGSYSGSVTGAFQRVYNVLSYGAVNDTVTNSTASVQATLNACHAAGGGVVYFPAGGYLCNKIETYRDVSIKGDGWTTSFIRSAGTDTLIVMHNLTYATSGGYLGDQSNKLIEDVYLDGYSRGTVGFYTDEACNFKIGRITLNRFTHTAMYLKNTIIGEVDGCKFFYNPRGIVATATTGNATNHVTIRNCVINYCSSRALDWSGGGMLSLENDDFELNGTGVDTATGSIFYHDNPWPGGLSVLHCWFEQNLGTNIAIYNNVSYQGGLAYPLETTHSIINCQDLGQNYSFTKRNVYLKGNYQRLSIIASSLTGSEKSVIADGNSTTNVNVYGSVLLTNTMRGGSVLTTTGQ